MSSISNGLRTEEIIDGIAVLEGWDRCLRLIEIVGCAENEDNCIVGVVHCHVVCAKVAIEISIGLNAVVHFGGVTA